MKYLTWLLTVLFLSLSAYCQAPVKNVLLEEFSTAPCGFCPEGGIIAEKLIHKYPHLYTFTHHAGFGTDSMTIGESSTIAAKYTKFAPAAAIDRGHYPIPVYTKEGYIGVSRQKWDSVCAERLNEPAEAIVSFVSLDFQKESRLLNAELSVQFLTEKSSNDFRFNLAIVEDSVSGVGKGWDQKNYFNNDPTYPELYHKGDSIVGYQHRHVLRALPTGAWGKEGLIPSIPETGVTYTYKLEDYKIPDRWKPEDITLFAFVSYYNTDNTKHKILNTDVRVLPGYGTNDVPEAENGAAEPKFSVWPNPAGSLAYIRLDFTEPTKAKIELFSSLGAKIRDIAGSDNYTDNIVYFHTSDLAPGVYYLKVTHRNGSYGTKFTVAE